MKKLFADNQWGYDISKTNPFWIALYNLREVAKDSVGEENIYDLSRGDPGYGFAPNVRSRDFYSYLIFLDTVLNNFKTNFITDNRNFNELMSAIKEATEKQYSSKKAENYLQELDYFIKEIMRISEEQNLGFTERDIFFHLFKYASVSGGCYHDPQGEEICRAVVADYHSKKMGEKILADDLIFTHGVSDGIATFFQLMDEKEGIGYIKKGDTIVTSSPAYAPYNMIFKNRGINVLSISFNPVDGSIDPATLEAIQNYKGKIKLFSLIDPNNPTGFAAPSEFKKKIVDLAKSHDAIILTDEVYFSFLSNVKSIYSYAPERTIRMDARSKIERSTGLRFGDILVSEPANKYISNLLKDYLPADTDFKKAIMLAKAPGGTKGEFMHTTFVPGPSQFLGICHIIFGKKERKIYVDLVQKNVDEFARILGIRQKGNVYYTVFDLNEIATSRKKQTAAEEKFYELAKRGIILIPAYLFFSKEDQLNNDYANSARACLPNLTFANTQKAAKIIKDYLSE